MAAREEELVNESDRYHHADSLTHLWRYYEEHAQHAREHEQLRAHAASTMAAMAAAVVGLAGISGLSKADVPAGLVVVVLGGLGAALSIKHYERFKMHTSVMKAVRDEIDRVQAEAGWTGPDTGQLRKTGEARHAAAFGALGERKRRPVGAAGQARVVRVSPWVDRVRLNLLWLGLPTTVGLIGLVVIVFSFRGV
jgi:hypothetical protein